MRELKTKINPMELNIPDFMLPPKQVNAFIALTQATKTALNTHMWTHVTAQVLNKVSSLIITGGLKPHIWMEILKRDGLTLPQIK